MHTFIEVYSRTCNSNGLHEYIFSRQYLGIYHTMELLRGLPPNELLSINQSHPDSWIQGGKVYSW